MSDDDHKLMDQEGHWHHTGDKDRRKGPRRQGHDRRDMIRFEPDKDDRRSGNDRRGQKDKWGSDDPI